MQKRRAEANLDGRLSEAAESDSLALVAVVVMSSKCEHIRSETSLKPFEGNALKSDSGRLKGFVVFFTYMLRKYPYMVYYYICPETEREQTDVWQKPA